MNYLLKRFLWSIPTLFAVVLIGFVLLLNTPGDPVNTILHISTDEDPLQASNNNIEKQKKEWENKLGLNLPLFYVTLQSSSLPKEIYKITDPREKRIVRILSLKSRNPDAVLDYRKSLRTFRELFNKELKKQPDSTISTFHLIIDDLSSAIIKLSNETNIEIIEATLEKMNQSLVWKLFPESWKSFYSVRYNFQRITKDHPKNTIIPSIQVHQNSRFHQWLFGDGKYSRGIIRGDFGISYVTRESINTHIYKSLFWSILFSGIGILLAYLISIPIGIRSAIHHNRIGEKIVTIFLFAIYSIPVFFLGTLLQTYLANHQYLYIFEPTGIQPVRGFPPDSSFLERIWATMPYMVLPIICFTYSSIAFLSRLTKTSISETLNQPYILTARAKGLPFKKVVYKHAFRNALIPLVTVFANVFPVLVGGSVLIETIFTIPGMGTEMFNAYFAHNIPVIISIFTLTGIFTVVGFFISDVLYVIVDPRIRK